MHLDRHPSRRRCRVHRLRALQPIDAVDGAVQDQDRTATQPHDGVDWLGRPHVLAAAEACGAGDQRECELTQRETGVGEAGHHRGPQPLVG